MKEARKAETFLWKNAPCRKSKGHLVPLDIDQRRLPIKCNKIKRHWGQILDSKKNGSELSAKVDPEWFIIVSVVLSDTYGGINAVCSGPLDTSLADTNLDGFNSKNEVAEEIEYNDASFDEQESQNENFYGNVKKRKTLLGHGLVNLLKMLKTKKRLSLNHTRKKSSSHITSSYEPISSLHQ